MIKQKKGVFPVKKIAFFISFSLILQRRKRILSYEKSFTNFENYPVVYFFTIRNIKRIKKTCIHSNKKDDDCCKSFVKKKTFIFNEGLFFNFISKF
jgi:hypothetical protein